MASLPTCNASDDAGLAAEIMGQYNTDAVAVKDDLEDGKIIGADAPDIGARTPDLEGRTKIKT